jgi:hypothetical protein
LLVTQAPFASPAPENVTATTARAIAGRLFPAQCGRQGERCAITHDGKRGCPRELVVTFPNGAKDAAPIRAWITLDAVGAVREASTNEPAPCRAQAPR